MIGRDYSAWSDTTLTRIEQDTPTHEVSAEFLAELQKPQPNAESLIHSYKLSLARGILAYRPIVSPSTFLLDVQGSVARYGNAEELANERIVGLTAEQQFVPLPRSVRQAHPELATQFIEAYHAYRNQAVTPFLEALRSCHALIVLTDVTTLLSAGVGMYNENYQILSELFRILDPGETPMETFGRHLADLFLPRELRPGWINRIAFVTPKMDLIHPQGPRPCLEPFPPTRENPGQGPRRFEVRLFQLCRRRFDETAQRSAKSTSPRRLAVSQCRGRKGHIPERATLRGLGTP